MVFAVARALLSANPTRPPSAVQRFDQQNGSLHSPAPDLDLLAFIVEVVGLGRGDLEKAVSAADI